MVVPKKGRHALVVDLSLYYEARRRGLMPAAQPFESKPTGQHQITIGFDQRLKPFQAIEDEEMKTPGTGSWPLGTRLGALWILISTASKPMADMPKSYIFPAESMRKA